MLGAAARVPIASEVHVAVALDEIELQGAESGDIVM
jgi:hypothetical protein